jgi:hypothetical protein
MQQLANATENYNPVMPTNPADIEKQVAASRPDYAKALNTPSGEDLLNTITQAAKERQALTEDQLGPQMQRQHQLDISNSLLAAAEGTRGTGNNLAGLMSGIVAGTAFNNKALAAEMARQNTLKSQSIEAKIADAKIADLIEERRRAAANNNVADLLKYNKEITDLQNQKKMLQINTIGQMLSPAAQLDHARITANATLSAADRPTDLMKDASALMKSTGMSLQDAMKTVGSIRATGTTTSAQERLQKEALDKMDKIREGYSTILRFMDPNDPKRAALEANMKKELDDAKAQYSGLGVNFGNTAQPAANPSPTGMPGLPPPSTGGFVVHR